MASMPKKDFKRPPRMVQVKPKRGTFGIGGRKGRDPTPWVTKREMKEEEERERKEEEKRKQEDKSKGYISKAWRSSDEGRARGPTGPNAEKLMKKYKMKSRGKGLVDTGWMPALPPPEYRNRHLRMFRKREKVVTDLDRMLAAEEEERRKARGENDDEETKEPEEEKEEEEEEKEDWELEKENGGKPAKQNQKAANAAWMDMDMSAMEEDVGANRNIFVQMYKQVEKQVFAIEAVHKWRVKKGYKVYGIDPRVDMHREEYQALLLREMDVGRLFKVFNEIDGDQSGEISITELLKFLDLEQTPFTKAIFMVMDEDKSGEIDFREFIIALWNYCTLSKSTLVMFAFDMYDRDNSGVIDDKEVLGMLKDVYGPGHAESAQAAQIRVALADMTKQRDWTAKATEINVEEFFDFTRYHPGLLYPAFLLQHQMQLKICGEKFWAHHAKQRIYLSDGQYVEVAKLLRVHVEAKTFNLLRTMNKKGEEQEAMSVFKSALNRTGVLKFRRAFRGFGDEDEKEERDFDEEAAVVREKNKKAIEQARTELLIQPEVDFGSDSDEEDDDVMHQDSYNGNPKLWKKSQDKPPGMRDSYVGQNKVDRMKKGASQAQAAFSGLRQLASRHMTSRGQSRVGPAGSGGFGGRSRGGGGTGGMNAAGLIRVDPGSKSKQWLKHPAREMASGAGPWRGEMTNQPKVVMVAPKPTPCECFASSLAACSLGLTVHPPRRALAHTHHHEPARCTACGREALTTPLQPLRPAETD